MGKSFKRILTVVLTLCLILTTVSLAAGAGTPVAAPEITVENEFDGIQISWADVAGASSYEVLRKGADEETEKVIATVTTTSFTDSDVLAGYKYYYEVKAIAADGSSAVSQPDSITRSLYFGSYEQDNDFSNGKEPIEWLVTKIQDGKLFLVSKYCLDSQFYNDEYTDVTWETCTLRAWLNNDFFNTAFSEEEQLKICDTNVANGANFTYKTPGGNNTVDKIFLLNLSESRSVFPTVAERIADSTAYALAQGAYQEPRFGTSWYWTRTPGYTHDSTVYVCGEGDTYFSGNVVNREGGAVRPAMWIEVADAVAQNAVSVTLASPAISTANVSDGVRVSWTAASNAVRYAVYRRTGAETFDFIASTTELSFVDKTVTAGTKYFYMVHAYDAEGNYSKSVSTAIAAQPSADVALTAPVIALETFADGVYVRWTSEPAAVEYKVYRKVNIIGEYELVKTTTDFVYVDHDIKNGTGYYYKIRAVDSDGDFLTCRTYGITASFDGSGANETSFEINAVNKVAGIDLKWPVVDGVSQYTVSRKIVGETDYEVLASIPVSGYLDKTAQAGVKYSYKVSADAAVATETVSRSVFFGSYEQDGVTENGTEPIEWIVLDDQDGKMLLISRLNLDLYAFHDEYVVTTWEESSLRAWLNDEFMNNAFSEKEQASICESLLVNEDSPYFNTEGGNDTVDKVFVLSMSEASKYFGADGDRQADTTEYAKVQGSYPNKNYGTSWYWSRTPGYSGDYFTFVSGNGAPFIGGNTVDHNSSAVRPAIWISKDAIVVEEPTVEDLDNDELIFGAGVGKIVFTDEVFATRPSGFAVDAAHTGEQDLHVRVFLMENTEAAAVVSVEIMSLPSDLIATLQNIVADKTGIPKENIWVHANHISSTPHAPSDDAGNAAFCTVIANATEAALDQAMSSRQKATLTVVQGELNINRNRDTWINGLAAYGYDNLTGFSNKTISVLCFKDTEGDPIGICYSYGVKPWVIATIGMSTNERFYSSDISGMACLMAEAAYSCPAMYVMPATADQVTEISAKATRYNEEKNKIEEYVQLTAEEGIAAKNKIGAQLGEAVLALVEESLVTAPLSDATVSVGNTSFKWDNAAGTSQVSIAISAITIGDENGVAMVGLMPETNAITEKQLQDASPYKYTLVATFVNGDQKYMPDSASYPNESNYNVGTFEYKKTGFAIGCAEEFVHVAVNMLEAINDGTYVDASGEGSAVGEYLGGTIEFGGYTWTKLAEENGKYLVLSNTVVDTRAYNDIFEETTWENSTLRKYLNEEFYNKFSDSEKAAIVKVTNVNEANQVYGFPGGNDTEDYVFLLSLSEAEKYLKETDLIIGKDADGTAHYWWLRSPGEAGDVPSGISTTGLIDYHGPISKITGVLGVRPAMWISAEEILAPDVEEPADETYTVAAGDNLWNIAKRIYGNGAKWSVIFEANKSTIKDANLIYVGQTLNIPGL